MPRNGMNNKYHISRLTRKLTLDDQKVLIALPRDIVSERTWAEVLQKEDNELLILEMREEIVEQALQIGFERYMERQTALFTAHCAAQAWLKLIDWHFYRHDPGEDPTAYPPCFIPKRVESWTPDEMPDPSPKDSWARHNLNIVEEVTEEGLKKWPSSESIELPVVEEIPRECRFPGKVHLPGYVYDECEYYSVTYDESGSSDLAAESELLQKVTNYTPKEDVSLKESFTGLTGLSSLQGTSLEITEEPTSPHGGDDSGTRAPQPMRTKSTKSKMLNRSSIVARSKGLLPPLASDSRSRVSKISDCRLRSLRDI